MRAALPVGGDGHSQPWRRSGRSPSCECCAGCRHPSFDATEDSLLEWRTTARETFTDALLMPALPALRAAAVGSVEVARSYEHDGVRIEELSWQLPYGPRTQALFLTPRPTGVVEPGSLPALLALHCHGGQKVFGLEKITVRKSPFRSDSSFQACLGKYRGLLAISKRCRFLFAGNGPATAPGDGTAPGYLLRRPCLGE